MGQYKMVDHILFAPVQTARNVGTLTPATGQNRLRLLGLLYSTRAAPLG